MLVAHLTSVHPREDVRIFHKECRTLAKAGYDVSLVVADGKGDETREGVSIIDVGRTEGGRWSRMTATRGRVLHQALELDADIYHFHDPELLPAGLTLRSKGKRVIYDAHETFPATLKTKPYIPWPLNFLGAWGFGSNTMITIIVFVPDNLRVRCVHDTPFTLPISNHTDRNSSPSVDR